MVGVDNSGRSSGGRGRHGVVVDSNCGGLFSYVAMKEVVRTIRFLQI